RVTGGQLTLNAAGGGAIPGDLTVAATNGGGLVRNVLLAADNQLSGSGKLTMTQGVLDMAGFDATVGDLAMNGGTILGNGSVLTMNNLSGGSTVLNAGMILAGLDGSGGFNKTS